jgi:RNA polymerase sigma factor (sigma-70 family)
MVSISAAPEARGKGRVCLRAPLEGERRALLLQHLHLTKVVALKLARCFPWVDLRELTTFAFIGLERAAHAFLAELGVPFPAYAELKMRSAIHDGVRGLSAIPRRQRQYVTALIPDEDATWLRDTAPLPDEAIETDENKSELDGKMGRAVAKLPERHRYILLRHDVDGVELKSIADELRVSKAQVTRLRQDAIGFLRTALVKGRAPDYLGAEQKLEFKRKAATQLLLRGVPAKEVARQLRYDRLSVRRIRRELSGAA